LSGEMECFDSIGDFFFYILGTNCRQQKHKSEFISVLLSLFPLS